ncbi:biotin-dependent carboxyltransferase family protein [Rhizobium sp. TH2]|uniref:5-oxoprolinase subunit C family protein n=1 Tax=Rhizobium sp. TH2 TaxID=2775403 RepID=UPI0021577A64|nr:biotin-dependent carboxyltransferase family protein [Rhizobium sp. TH2]UVC08761.1 biotin-dependent carboxyltransferase family protein [Rhizobium sp. TH2]
MIEILTSGLMNSVQDLGRPGFLDQGIGRGGAMDRPALRIANLLLGNDEGAAAIEIAIFPFRMKFIEPAKFSVTGANCPAMLNGNPIPPWWAQTANAGDELRLDPPSEGLRAYVAVGGGLDLPQVLGSRATDLKSVFGGLEGRALIRGDKLTTGSLFSPAGRSAERMRGDEGAPPTRSSGATRHLLPAGEKREFAGHGADPYYFRECLGGSPSGEALTLRVMPGAEFDAFTDGAREAFFSTDYEVSADNNRQGMRLEGPALALTSKLELMSHGIMPGTIQVPPSGAPVIQLAEANTCGGYPKFAHVIEPDLWKLAQAPSGATMRFLRIGRDAAVEAIRADELKLRRLNNLMPAAAVRKAG